MRTRSVVLGLLLAAVLTLISAFGASPATAAKKAAKRPTDFAVGTTTLKFDNQGRTVTATVYYPATGRPSTLVIEDAPRDTRWGPYPLILFSHALGATTTPYRQLLHTWTQAGYVVAVPTYAASADEETDASGKVVVDLGARVADAGFVIDRMLDKVQGGFGAIVDPNRIAAAGHALGASTTYVLALNTEAHDQRIRAAVTIGGSLAGDASLYFTDVDAAFLAFHGDADVTDPIADATQVFALASPPKFFVTLLGADQTSPFATASDPALRVVEDSTLDFFAAYLRGRPSGLQQLLRDAKVAEVSRIQSALR